MFLLVCGGGDFSRENLIVYIIYFVLWTGVYSCLVPSSCMASSSFTVSSLWWHIQAWIWHQNIWAWSDTDQTWNEKAKKLGMPILTLGGRGEQILPAQNIRKLKPPNLVTFPKIYLETIWCNMSLPIKCDITMATTFWQVFFFRILKFPLLNKKSLPFWSKYYIFRSFPC